MRSRIDIVWLLNGTMLIAIDIKWQVKCSPEEVRMISCNQNVQDESANNSRIKLLSFWMTCVQKIKEKL